MAIKVFLDAENAEDELEKSIDMCAFTTVSDGIVQLIDHCFVESLRVAQ